MSKEIQGFERRDSRRSFENRREERRGKMMGDDIPIIVVIATDVTIDMRGPRINVCERKLLGELHQLH